LTEISPHVWLNGHYVDRNCCCCFMHSLICCCFLQSLNCCCFLQSLSSFEDFLKWLKLQQWHKSTIFRLVLLWSRDHSNNWGFFSKLKLYFSIEYVNKSDSCSEHQILVPGFEHFCLLFNCCKHLLFNNT